MKNKLQKTFNRGFSLIATITLMILLALIAVGLLSLSAVTVRTANQSKDMETARANARLALTIAIGELQKALGPDKAVTATSEIVSASPAKSNLVGVWDSWDFDPSNPSLDYEGEKSNRFQYWLVSSEDAGARKNQGFVESAWSGRTVELVGETSLGGLTADREKVIAGLVPISDGEDMTGSFAWHVSDESVKARVNLYREPSDSGDPLWEKRSVLAGHRPEPSVISNSEGRLLDFLPSDYTAEDFEGAQETVAKVVDRKQVDLLAGSSDFQTFRNDVTPYSMGVMTDVRRGGLKEDLSSVFEMSTSSTTVRLPPELSGRRLYESTHKVSGVSDPYWSTLSSYYNSFRSITNPDSNPTFYGAPSTASTVHDLEPPQSFYPGPVIAKVEALFNFVVRDAHGVWQKRLTDIDPRMGFMGHLVYTPIVTLHNPYNVKIEFDELEVRIRNIPLAFQFFVNGLAQSSQPVPMTELFFSAGSRDEITFLINIANWSTPKRSTTNGPITMNPGQTLICGPYFDPGISFANGNETFFNYRNDLTGVDGAPVRAKPGFRGRCVGFDLDWLTPTHGEYAARRQSDGDLGVLGLRPTDSVRIDFGVEKPTQGLSTAFEVSAKIKANGESRDYGGLSFQYNDDETLKTLFENKVHSFPNSGTLTSPNAYVPNTDPLSRHASAQTFSLFSAYARTTNGGVYETGSRSPQSGALNKQLDGRIAGKPYLFHNPARTVMTVNLADERLGAQSHEMNLQPLGGGIDDILELDSVTNRTSAITGNTTTQGIKSGSYLELPSGAMQTIADFRRSNALTSSYLPGFVQPVANSSVSPLMSTSKVVETDSSVASYELLDHSVLANHALYDRFYFSTFATAGNQTPEERFQGFMEGRSSLSAQSFQPYLPKGWSIENAQEELYSAGVPKANAYQSAASFQMVSGPFNVNSTSVQAWKAKLASMKNSEVVTLWAKSAGLENSQAAGAPILSMSLVNGGLVNSGDVSYENIDNAKTNEWNGYRDLDDAQLQALAEEIVMQVRTRGPFLSLSEFVNRQVGPESELSRRGALATAIANSGVNEEVFQNQVPITVADVSDENLYNFKTPQATIGNPAEGAPSWITQGDIMRILEPAVTVRSDTFVIRVCGEAADAAGKVTARAYAEAVVQRFPDYVDSANGPSVNAYLDSEATLANQKFGRRMNVTSFRWLKADEI